MQINCFYFWGVGWGEPDFTKLNCQEAYISLVLKVIFLSNHQLMILYKPVVLSWGTIDI